MHFIVLDLIGCYQTWRSMCLPTLCVNTFGALGLTSNKLFRLLNLSVSVIDGVDFFYLARACGYACVGQVSW